MSVNSVNMSVVCTLEIAGNPKAAPPDYRCVMYFGSGRGASHPVEVLKTLAIHRRASARPLESSWFVPK